MLDKSNSSQKNKGDIAEMVSAPFTYIKGPDDKYIRNFINTYTIQQNVASALKTFTKHKKSLEIILGYLLPYTITDEIKTE